MPTEQEEIERYRYLQLKSKMAQAQPQQARQPELSQPATPAPSMFQRFKAGFMEKDIPQPKGFERGDVAEFAGRSGLETLGGTIGGVFGAGIGGVATPIAPATTAWGMGIGAGAGKAAHEAIRRGIGAFKPGSTEMGSPAGVAGKVIGEGVVQGLGGRYLPPVINVGGEVVAATARLGGRIVQPIVRGISGVSKQAMDTMVDSPSKVLKFIGTSAEDIANHAKAFVSAVEQNASRAGEAYRNIINDIVRSNAKYGPEFKIDITSDLAPVVNEVKRDFGYGLKGRISDEAETKIFQKFAVRASELLRATVDEAYFFQKDLTNAIKQNIGKPISAALGRLRSATIGKISSSVPEIAQANKIYAHAMNLDDELSRVTNADNAASIIKNAFKNKTGTRDAIIKLADESANARKSLEGVLYGSAGSEFTPLMRDLPPTGFTAGLGAGGAAAFFNPATIPFMLPAATMLSPRAVGYGTAGLSRAGSLIRQGAGARPIQQAIQYGTPAIMANKQNLLPFNYMTEQLRKKYQERR